MRSVYGMYVCQDWRSPIFSAPRWWKPISGTASTISSPSSWRTMRSTPCVPGMLRADVEEQEIGILARAAKAPFLGAEAQSVLLFLFLLRRKVERSHFGSARGVLLAKRMSLPGARHQDSFEVRMTCEADAEHVPHF